MSTRNTRKPIFITIIIDNENNDFDSISEYFHDLYTHTYKKDNKEITIAYASQDHKSFFCYRCYYTKIYGKNIYIKRMERIHQRR